MKFETYFVLDQKVIVRRFATSKTGSRVESFRAKLTARDENLFKLTLSRPDQSALFSTGDFLELHSERFGLGVRLTGFCLYSSTKTLLFEAQDDLEIFYRRKYWRMTLPVWAGVIRMAQSLVPLSDVWEKAQIQRDEHNQDPSIHVEIMRQLLNLSAGGVRMELQAPVAVHEKCLLYLCLDDGQPTICALCDVVWVETGEAEGGCLCGLRFSALLESDLQRIDRYVAKNCKLDPSERIEQSHTV